MLIVRIPRTSRSVLISCTTASIVACEHCFDFSTRCKHNVDSWTRKAYMMYVIISPLGCSDKGNPVTRSTVCHRVYLRTAGYLTDVYCSWDLNSERGLSCWNCYVLVLITIGCSLTQCKVQRCSEHFNSTQFYYRESSSHPMTRFPWATLKHIIRIL